MHVSEQGNQIRLYPVDQFRFSIFISFSFSRFQCNSKTSNRKLYLIRKVDAFQFPSSKKFNVPTIYVYPHCCSKGNQMRFLSTGTMKIEFEGNFHKQHSFKVFFSSVFRSPRTLDFFCFFFFSLQPLQIPMHSE